MSVQNVTHESEAAHLSAREGDLSDIEALRTPKSAPSQPHDLAML
ncbi:hypothetical protein ACVW19_004606 [Streptomyces sp. TE5632]